MKKILAILSLVILSIVGVLTLSSCAPYESQVQQNLLRETGNFNTYRKITVINLRSDKVLMEFQGWLTSKLDSEGDVNIIIKTGPNTYQLHYVRLAAEVTYLSEQIDNTSTDPYHYEINIYAIWPDVKIG